MLRKIHNYLSIIILLPLINTVLTGVLFQFLSLWIGIPHENLKILMKFHQGSIFGLKSYYATLLGIYSLIQE
jgi:hypothetical protein